MSKSKKSRKVDLKKDKHSENFTVELPKKKDRNILFLAQAMGLALHPKILDNEKKGKKGGARNKQRDYENEEY